MFSRNFRNFLTFTRSYASANRVKPNRKPQEYKLVEAQVDSLRARGFLRPLRAYEPPQNVKEIVSGIVKELGGVKNFKEQKFEFLNRCCAAFSNHSVPNSLLFEVRSIDDVIEFYSTPIDTQTPYEKLDRTVPNLHIISEYRRYNPEEDGPTAFPKSSTLVTGLKNRKKYAGYKAKMSWP